MQRIARFVLFHKRIVIAVFLAAAVICGVLIPLVQTNYRLADYLPDHVPSTLAMNVMDEHFNEPIPNVAIMLEDQSLTGALAFKERIRQSPGVLSVQWLDDYIDLQIPIEMARTDVVEAWYKDGYALYQVTIDRNSLTDAVDGLRALVGDQGVVTGEAVNQAVIQNTTLNDVPKMLLYVVPLVLLVLLLSTSSWFEPLLFLVIIGTAIVLNEGTNIFLGEVSYLTRSTSAILQLAVSMDYAIFLLHRFARYRHGGTDLHASMIRAMAESAPVIVASAATTAAGFLALVLMRFGIGPDMGWVLAKGIFFSLISVMLLLPVLAVTSTNIMERTHHRPLLPSFDRFAKVVVRICVPLALLLLVLIVPGYLGQRSNTFIYGSSGIDSEESILRQDADRIEAIFGDAQQMVLLVPQGQASREAELVRELESMERIEAVIAYTNTIGAQIPESFIEPEVLAQFQSGGYRRIILLALIPDEGDVAFGTIESIREKADQYYPGEAHLIGVSAVNYDLWDTITRDNEIVNIAVMVAIGLVLLFTFRSLSIPLILLLAIRGATWINLSIPYFSGNAMNYIGYLIISSVQLGATVDYGILFIKQYLENRKSHGKREAIMLTVSESSLSILTPASILFASGLILGILSSNDMIGQFGIILGRGAMISASVVLLALPGLLFLFDKLLRKTTWQPKGKKEGE